MRKWMLVIVIVFLAAGCGTCPRPAAAASASVSSRPAYVEHELVAVVKDQKEAQDIASLYGIELQQYDSGIAVFRTDEDLDAVISRGEQNGWPQLQKNYLYYPE